MRYSYMDFSEVKNITKHLPTDNKLFFSHLFTVYTSFHNRML